MTLTEMEFFQEQYAARKKYIQARYQDWTIEDHLQALIVPQQAFFRAYRENAPPELKRELEKQVAEHGDALRMIHAFKRDIGEAVAETYAKLPPAKQREIDKHIENILNWSSGRL